MLGILKLISRHIVSIALLLVGLIIGGYLIGAVHNVRDSLFPETAAYVRSPITIVNSIKGIGQLVTVTSEVAKTDVKVEIHEGILNYGYYSANHVVIGAIEAGINFDSVGENSIRAENDSYILTLPAPSITSCRIEHIDQNQYSFTMLPADWDMVRQLAQADALMQFVEKMIEAGILERAEEETALRMGDLVRALTGKPVQVAFAARNGQMPMPESCQAIAPSGWEKTEEGAWKRTN